MTHFQLLELCGRVFHADAHLGVEAREGRKPGDRVDFPITLPGTSLLIKDGCSPLVKSLRAQRWEDDDSLTVPERYPKGVFLKKDFSIPETCA